MIYYIPREETSRGNNLAQSASGYEVRKRNFLEQKTVFGEVESYVLEEPVQPPPPPSQTAPRGEIPLQMLFLLKLLRTKWMIALEEASGYVFTGS